MSQNLKYVHEQFPGLPAAALEFFHFSNTVPDGSKFRPRNISEFAHHISQPDRENSTRLSPPSHQINRILQRMADLNLVTACTNGNPLLGDATYICDLSDEEKTGVLDALNYMVFGFPVIYEELQHSVIPIVHTKCGLEQIGSSFLRTRYILLTAAHCLEGADGLKIRGIHSEQFRRARIAIHRNRALDLAAIKFVDPILPDVTEIGLGGGSVLDEVLVLGYPNVPGFTELLAAEKAAVSARIAVTSGTIASSATEIFAKTSLFLITARVRGGFSGGPVIDHRGLAVGLVSRQPLSGTIEGADIFSQYDNLGYGVAIPAEEITAFLSACSRGDTEIVEFIDGSNFPYSEFCE